MLLLSRLAYPPLFLAFANSWRIADWGASRASASGTKDDADFYLVFDLSMDISARCSECSGARASFYHAKAAANETYDEHRLN